MGASYRALGRSRPVGGSTLRHPPPKPLPLSQDEARLGLLGPRAPQALPPMASPLLGDPGVPNHAWGLCPRPRQQ
jgi:hypothetical protein